MKIRRRNIFTRQNLVRFLMVDLALSGLGSLGFLIYHAGQESGREEAEGGVQIAAQEYYRVNAMLAMEKVAEVKRDPKIQNLLQKVRKFKEASNKIGAKVTWCATHPFNSSVSTPSFSYNIQAIVSVPGSTSSIFTFSRPEISGILSGWPDNSSQYCIPDLIPYDPRMRLVGRAKSNNSSLNPKNLGGYEELLTKTLHDKSDPIGNAKKNIVDMQTGEDNFHDNLDYYKNNGYPTAMVQPENFPPVSLINLYKFETSYKSLRKFRDNFNKQATEAFPFSMHEQIFKALDAGDYEAARALAKWQQTHPAMQDPRDRSSRSAVSSSPKPNNRGSVNMAREHDNAILKEPPKFLNGGSKGFAP